MAYREICELYKELLFASGSEANTQLGCVWGVLGVCAAASGYVMRLCVFSFYSRYQIYYVGGVPLGFWVKSATHLSDNV